MIAHASAVCQLQLAETAGSESQIDTGQVFRGRQLALSYLMGPATLLNSLVR
jgi:hypothetical protein